MIKSPCIRNCCLDKQDICVGCFRHVDEIIQWQSLDDNGKQQVLNKAKRRKERSS